MVIGSDWLTGFLFKRFEQLPVKMLPKGLRKMAKAFFRSRKTLKSKL